MFERRKVLILDASPIFRRTLQQVIEAGETLVDITATDSAEQAGEVLRRAPADVIFLDIALPLSSGLRFIETVKEASPETTVVVLTSHDSVEHREAALGRGADFFLSKERSGGLRLIDVIRTTVRRQESG